ncbi:MAG: hypothetical protein ABW185_27850 [Sedimenticola sp.]
MPIGTVYAPAADPAVREYPQAAPVAGTPHLPGEHVAVVEMVFYADPGIVDDSPGLTQQCLVVAPGNVEQVFPFEFEHLGISPLSPRRVRCTPALVRSSQCSDYSKP